MKQLILRNLQLRYKILIVIALLLLIAPIYYHIHQPMVKPFIELFISAIIAYIAIVESGSVFMMHRTIGKNTAYYFNHSLPYSAKQQLNAHYVTTIIFSLLGASVLFIYGNLPVGVSYGKGHFSTPFEFMAINLIAHALAFPRYTELKKDYIPFIPYIILMNFILPIVIVMSFAMIQYRLGFEYLSGTDSLQIFYSVILFAVAVLAFMGTYLYQFKKIKQAEKKN